MNSDIYFQSFSKEEIKKEIERISNEYCDGNIPSIKTIKENSNIPPDKMKYEAGSWKTVLSIYICDKDKIKSEIVKIANERNKKPTLDYFTSNSIYSRHHIIRVFGKWNNALEYSGYEKRIGVGSGSNHPNWQGGSVQYYGENWNVQREKAWERDSIECRVCEDNEKIKGNKKPDVHHITPRKFWKISEYEKMNDINNLICLCKSCHHKLEGKFKGRNHEEFEELAKDYLDIDEKEEKQSIFDY